MTNDCVQRNEKNYNGRLDPRVKERLIYLKKFINKRKPSIDIGCGCYTPKYLNTTHACDNGEIAKKYLKKLGWKGEFKKADITKLPYSDKQFSCSVCSEVIEHLSTEEKVKKAFLEIDRVSKSWLITTPAIIIDDPDHKFFFTGDHLFDIIPFKTDYFIIICKGIYFYISNDKERLCKILEVKK